MYKASFLSSSRQSSRPSVVSNKKLLSGFIPTEVCPLIVLYSFQSISIMFPRSSLLFFRSLELIKTNFLPLVYPY